MLLLLLLLPWPCNSWLSCPGLRGGELLLPLLRGLGCLLAENLVPLVRGQNPDDYLIPLHGAILRLVALHTGKMPSRCIMRALLDSGTS